MHSANEIAAVAAALNSRPRKTLDWKTPAEALDRFLPISRQRSCCDDHLNPPCVRWYLRYKLSFRDLVEMMAERGLSLAHTTIMRWIQRYAPEFEKRWNRFARPVGQSWRVDETYVKIKGRWTYLYRCRRQRREKDRRCSASRQARASPRPRCSSDGLVRGQGRLPHKITLDGYQASHRAASEVLGEHPEGNRCEIRSSKYLNNLIEQDHRSIKLRLGPMLGFKRFSESCNDDRRHRTHAPDQKGSVQTRQTSRQKQNRA